MHMHNKSVKFASSMNFGLEFGIVPTE